MPTMKYKTTEAFVKMLNERKIAYNSGTLTQTMNDASGAPIKMMKEVVQLTVKGDNNLEMKIRFLFDENNRSAVASVLDVADVPDDKLELACMLINDINTNIRVAKYLITKLKDENGVWHNVMSCRIDMDFDNNAGIASLRTLDYLAKIGNRYYSTIQQKLFGEEAAAAPATEAAE